MRYLAYCAQLSLEPFAPPKPVLYYVVCPAHLLAAARMFFKVRLRCCQRGAFLSAYPPACLPATCCTLTWGTSFVQHLT